MHPVNDFRVGAFQLLKQAKDMAQTAMEENMATAPGRRPSRSSASSGITAGTNTLMRPCMFWRRLRRSASAVLCTERRVKPEPIVDEGNFVFSRDNAAVEAVSLELDMDTMQPLIIETPGDSHPASSLTSTPPFPAAGTTGPPSPLHSPTAFMSIPIEPGPPPDPVVDPAVEPASKLSSVKARMSLFGQSLSLKSRLSELGGSITKKETPRDVPGPGAPAPSGPVVMVSPATTAQAPSSDGGPAAEAPKGSHLLGALSEKFNGNHHHHPPRTHTNTFLRNAVPRPIRKLPSTSHRHTPSRRLHRPAAERLVELPELVAVPAGSDGDGRVR